MIRAPQRWSRAWRSAVILCGLTLPFGIATHIVGEVGALGWERGLPVVFGWGHAYFAWLGVAAIGLLARTIVTEPAQSRRSCVARIVASLPFRGRGIEFVALCFAVQLAFFALTQLLEGSPIGGGDMSFGIVVATVAAIVGSMTIAVAKRVLLGFVASICFTWLAARTGSPPRPSGSRRPPRTARRRWAILASRANRPPPARFSPA